jgi:hypothetical protein
MGIMSKGYKNYELAVVCDTMTIVGREFTYYGTWENPLFLAKDVATLIGHTKPDVMVKMALPHERVAQRFFDGKQNRNMIFLTEGGLYEVLMRSKTPIAVEFKDKVKELLHRRRMEQGLSFFMPPQPVVEFDVDSIISNPEKALAMLDDYVKSVHKQLE